MEPSRQEIMEAVEQFKAQGGVVKQIVPSKETEISNKFIIGERFCGGCQDPFEWDFSLTMKS